MELRQRIDLVGHYGLFRPARCSPTACRTAAADRCWWWCRTGHSAWAHRKASSARPRQQPQHAVQLERGFAMSRNEVSVGEFGRFVAATDYEPRATSANIRWPTTPAAATSCAAAGSTGAPVTTAGRRVADMPVVHVTARDAEAYAAWLSGQTGAHYRLPSEAEFEYALRAGSGTRFPWGEGLPPAGQDNLTGAGDRSPRTFVEQRLRRLCRRLVGPAPVNQFRREYTRSSRHGRQCERMDRRLLA